MLNREYSEGDQSYIGEIQGADGKIYHPGNLRPISNNMWRPQVASQQKSETSTYLSAVLKEVGDNQMEISS